LSSPNFANQFVPLRVLIGPIDATLLTTVSRERLLACQQFRANVLENEGGVLNPYLTFARMRLVDFRKFLAPVGIKDCRVSFIF
jgi:hypothetical protein